LCRHEGPIPADFFDSFGRLIIEHGRLASVAESLLGVFGTEVINRRELSSANWLSFALESCQDMKAAADRNLVKALVNKIDEAHRAAQANTEWQSALDRLRKALRH